MFVFFYALYRFISGIRAALADPEFEAIFSLVVIILATGTFFYHGAEQWGYLDSLYFSVVTLTTVGYGDLTPHTAAGKIFTMMYLFIGIGLLFSFMNVVAHHAVQEEMKKKLTKRSARSLLSRHTNEQHTSVPDVP